MKTGRLNAALQRLEHEMVLAAVRERGTARAAANYLEVSYRSMNYRLRKYDIYVFPGNKTKFTKELAYVHKAGK